MKKLKLPWCTSSTQLSAIAFGCMRLSKEVDVSEKVVLAAVERGYTLFDHADIYGGGACESVFGEILQRNPGLREKMVLQSKCAIGGGQYNFDYDYILRSVEASLKRLKVDHLDGLLLHRPDPLGEPEEVARAFDELLRQGKVKWFGVSNFTPWQIELYAAFVRQPLVVNQIQLSLKASRPFDEGVDYNRRGEIANTVGILDYCRLKKILVQAWSPLEGGSYSPLRSEIPENEKKATEVMAELCQKYNASPEAIKLAWLMRHPSGIQPVIGSVNVERVLGSAQGAEIHLDREEWYRLWVAARGRNVP